jgi:hypothetical protein
MPAAAVPAISQALPPGYDPAAEYEAQATCDPTPKPGTKKLADLIRRTYGRAEVVAISRGCGIGGTSEHKEGRALDWMTSIRSKREFANARAFLRWLLGPDQTGVPFGNATRLGVMYIGWNNRYWAAYAKDRGWAELKGCLTVGGDDTTCHRNHIHISLSWDGASGRTSLWDGTVLTGYCPAPWSEAPLATLGRALDVVAVPPVTVANTRLGQGVSPAVAQAPEWSDPATPPAPPAPWVPCRLHASGWRGDLPGLLVKVTGQPGVPEAGVAAVAVTVTALGSTAPATVSVWSPDEPAGTELVSVRMNGRGSGTAIVPVEADGTIGFATSAGATDLVVDVTGWFAAGDQPNVVAVS